MSRFWKYNFQLSPVLSVHHRWMYWTVFALSQIFTMELLKNGATFGNQWPDKALIFTVLCWQNSSQWPMWKIKTNCLNQIDNSKEMETFPVYMHQTSKYIFLTTRDAPLQITSSNPSEITSITKFNILYNLESFMNLRKVFWSLSER